MNGSSQPGSLAQPIISTGMFSSSNAANERSLWLVNPSYDSNFFIISGVFSLMLLIPYFIWGNASIMPIYNLYLVFFGLPHNYLTWVSILPPSARRDINLKALFYPALICFAVCIFIPFVSEGLVRNLILTFITMVSLWHAYRQHHGICKVYDAIQAKRTGDRSIFSDRKAMNLFFGLAAWAVVVWAFTHKEIRYLLSSDDFYNIIYPQLPYSLFEIYCVVTLLVGVYAFKRAFYDRYQAGKFLPWPQFYLMLMAILTYTIPYLVMPIEAMPLAVAIATIYHNIQYFGFVWMFEKQRSSLNAEKNLSLDLPQKLAMQGAWKRYFGIAMFYSVFIVALYLAFPKSIGLFTIYFIALAHYILDGIIWRNKNNSALGDVITALAKRS